MTLNDKMNEGLEEIQFKLARAKLEQNYMKKVRLLAEVSQSASDYAAYWEERYWEQRLDKK